jgi:hypothetical protein
MIRFASKVNKTTLVYKCNFFQELMKYPVQMRRYIGNIKNLQKRILNIEKIVIPIGSYSVAGSKNAAAAFILSTNRGIK